MKRSFIVLVLGAAVLSGCTAAPAPQPEPTSASPSSAAQAGCPDITAEDFAIQVESTPADPVELADSVGLADVLTGTCAYGFQSDQLNGVAFFIVDPSDEASGEFFAEALKAGLAAGFKFGDSQNQGTQMLLSGQRPDGAGFLIGHDSDVEVNDAEFTEERMAAIGLKPGDTFLFGSIQLP